MTQTAPDSFVAAFSEHLIESDYFAYMVAEIVAAVDDD